jgi:hypothetical protein
MSAVKILKNLYTLLFTGWLSDKEEASKFRSVRHVS